MNPRMRRWGEMLTRLEPDERKRMLDKLPADVAKDIAHMFSSWALDGQMPPPGDWRVWLILAGRGFGKTRAGAEWVTRVARKTGRTRIALVGATIEEARRVMVEGPAGLLACAAPHRAPKWEPSLNKLTFRSGAQAFLYSAENAEALRGPEHRYAWCDELAKWRDGDAVWMNLMMGLREGKDQRVVVTTTPRPVKLLKQLMADPATVRTGGRTADNVHLSPAYLRAVKAMYAGTRLGRQELDGELIEDVEGALWTRAMVEGCRSSKLLPGTGRGTAGTAVEGAQTLHSLDAGAPSTTRFASGSPPRSGEDFTRIVIGVDPPASSTGDACGIVVCGIDRAGVGYVLEDASIDRPSPDRWALAVADAAARWRADRIVAEANNGGDMVRSVLEQQDRTLPVSLVHATKGKSSRAEPVSFLYQQGRVRHAGAFPELEDQLCGILIAGGYQGPGRSPDRADALVWALTELMLGRRAEPRVLVL